jgi:hypothetical protein
LKAPANAGTAGDFKVNTLNAALTTSSNVKSIVGCRATMQCNRTGRNMRAAIVACDTVLTSAFPLADSSAATVAIRSSYLLGDGADAGSESEGNHLGFKSERTLKWNGRVTTRPSMYGKHIVDSECKSVLAGRLGGAA